MLIRKHPILLKSEVCIITKLTYIFDIYALIDHYLNWCGFDHISIYDNDSLCGDISMLFKDNDKVTIYKLPDTELNKTIQTCIYENHIKISNYDWILFCDDDEFLWFNKSKYKTINEFFNKLKYNNIECFIIPWFFMSYEANKTPKDRTQSLKYECFFTNQNISNPINAIYKPCIANNKKNVNFFSSHFINNRRNYYTFNNYYDRKNSVLNYNIEPQVPYITFNVNKSDILLIHYNLKTLNEWDIKMNRRDISRLGNFKCKEVYQYTKYDNSAYTNYINFF